MAHVSLMTKGAYIQRMGSPEVGTSFELVVPLDHLTQGQRDAVEKLLEIGKDNLQVNLETSA